LIKNQKKMDKTDFRNNTPAQVEEHLKENGFNKNNVLNFKNAFKKQNINKITGLSGVKNKFILSGLLPLEPLTFLKSEKDSNGNEKFIFKTFDDYKIESVLMPVKKNISICVSSQAGCRFGCSICQTAKLGFKRSLKAHEILEQLRYIFLNRIYPKRLSCVSFMGMGEPFDNLKNCMLAVKWINSNWLYQISREKINFSTSGVLKFKEFLSFNNLPNLAVSLHSAISEKRKIILPKVKINLKKLKKDMLLYVQKTKNRISLEYCLLKNFNDKKADAEALIEYCHDLPCKINLLNYNKVRGGSFNPVTEKEIFKFKKMLKEKKIPVLYRKSLGVEISAGCGQLGGEA